MIEKETQIESVIEEIKEFNKKAASNADNRLAEFLNLFNAKFEKQTLYRYGAETITWALFQTTISLFANGNNSSVIIEVYSIIEKFAIRDFPEIISEKENIQSIISDLISRKNLAEIADYYKKIGIWTNDDLAQLKKLIKIRNGIAHKNEKLISKALKSGNEVHYLNIDSITNKHDSADYILLAVDLFLKLSDYHKK